MSRRIAEKYDAPRVNGQLDKVAIADVIQVYLKERAPKTARPDNIAYLSGAILDFWGDKNLTDIRTNTAPSTCNGAQRRRARRATVGPSLTDREPRAEPAAHGDQLLSRQLWNATAIPVVTMPAGAPPRQDYWLTRKEVAYRIRVARKNKRWRHVVRMLLIGCYTGTRPGATVKLRWMPSIDGKGGWFDLATETLHRRGGNDALSKKIASRCRIHKRLLPWLRRWKAQDEAKGDSYVVHYLGKPLKKFRRTWAAVAKAAGHGAQTVRTSCGTQQRVADAASRDAGRGGGLSRHEPANDVERVRPRAS